MKLNTLYRWGPFYWRRSVNPTGDVFGPIIVSYEFNLTLRTIGITLVIVRRI